MVSGQGPDGRPHLQATLVSGQPRPTLHPCKLDVPQATLNFSPSQRKSSKAPKLSDRASCAVSYSDISHPQKALLLIGLLIFNSPCRLRERQALSLTLGRIWRPSSSRTTTPRMNLKHRPTAEKTRQGPPSQSPAGLVCVESAMKTLENTSVPGAGCPSKLHLASQDKSKPVN